VGFNPFNSTPLRAGLIGFKNPLNPDHEQIVRAPPAAADDE